MVRRGSRKKLSARLQAWTKGLLSYDLLWSALAVAAIVLIIAPRLGASYQSYIPGDIAVRDVTAQMDFQVMDPVSTERRELEAADRVADLYDFDPNAWQPAFSALNAMFSWGREQRAAAEAEGTWSALPPEARDEILTEAQTIAAVEVSNGLLVALWDAGFDIGMELGLAGCIKDLLTENLIGTLVPTQAGGGGTINIRDISTQGERLLTDPASITDLSTARQMVVGNVADRFEIDDETESRLGDLAASLMRPNLTFNSNETRSRRQQAVAAVEPAFYEIKRGRRILREGDEVTDQHVRELEAMEQLVSGQRPGLAVTGTALLVALAVISLWRYVVHYRIRFRYQRVRHLYLLTLLVLVSMVVVTRLSLFVGEAVASSATQEPFNVASAYRFAIPFAAGAILLLLLVDTQVAGAFGGVFAIIVATMTQDLALTVFSLLGTFAGIFGMSAYKQRTALVRTGLLVGSINAFAVLGFAVASPPLDSWDIISFSMVCAFAGGVLVSMLASFALPPLEHLFQSLTDIKLLELSNMNLPLLKELAVAAPGTYHHSVVVGTLAEKAADAIGVNSMFARVAAYYHDIGKIRQPQYFVENQRDGHNPHDKLTPHMSVLILVNHVKEGVASAEQHGLPQPLIDMIPQHHGTRQARYFLEKARQTAGEGNDVNPEDFRYPGPKPQSKEAAILMLADSVEAVSRTLDDPSVGRLQTMIHNTVHEVLDDGQLDECSITMADLAGIEEAFLAVLAGMHHQRIEYPSGDEKPEETAPSPPDENREAELPNQTHA